MAATIPHPSEYVPTLADTHRLKQPVTKVGRGDRKTHIQRDIAYKSKYAKIALCGAHMYGLVDVSATGQEVTCRSCRGISGLGPIQPVDS